MKINNIINSNKDYKIEKQKLSYHNLSDLEKDIFILINYIRTNLLDFANNLRKKNNYINNKEQIEVIKYLEELYNTEKLEPFEEIPEISEAARNLLINISLNDKKNHSINLKELNPETLNLRTRLSKYGNRTGRIFETVVFKTNNPEDIVNHILLEEKGRNMLLSGKMKYIGIACDILPSNIICSVIDIVQDFIPFRNKENRNSNININNNIYDNNINADYEKNQYNEEFISSNKYLNNENTINNLKLKLGFNKNLIENDKPNMNIIINNNEKYIQNLLFNKHYHQRRNNLYHQNKEFYRTPKKLASMDLPNEKSPFSPKSVNSYNIVINNKKVPIKNKVNNMNSIKNEEANNNNKDKKDNDKNNIFTMAGRTSKEQQQMINNSTKMNIIKSKSVSSFDFNLNNSKINNKNFQRLNQKEKIEILHKINQRNKNHKALSINNKHYEVNHNLSDNNFHNCIKNKCYNLEINIEGQNRNSNYINSEIQNNNMDNDNGSTNRFNTFMSNINDSNLVNYYNNEGISPLHLTYLESKNNIVLGNKDEYSNKKINEIKNDLLLFKNKIKEELKNEVKNEIKEEIKYEFNANQRKKKPNSIKIEQDLDIYNNKKKLSRGYNSQNDNNNKKILLNEIYYKKNGNNYFVKNKEKNRCCSEDKIIYANNNNKLKWNIKNERKSFEPQNCIQKNNYEENLKNEYKDRYELLNNLQMNDDSNYKEYQEIYQPIKASLSSNDLKNQTFTNEEKKIKNRQQIKQMIRLYNIAKDNKKNYAGFHDDILYDVINNNQSISNYFKQNNVNEDEYINNQIKEQNDNIYQLKETKREKNNINKNFFQKKYEKVKPIGNFYKSINNKKYVIESNIKYINEKKNLINENNEKVKEQDITKEKVLKKEKESENYKIVNENILSIEKIDNNPYQKTKNPKDNGEIKIKSYNEKNRIYKDLKKEIKNKIVFSKSVKLNKNDINEILDDNEKSFNNKSINTLNYNLEHKQPKNNNEYSLEKQKNENEKLKTPLQIKKETKYEININNNNHKKDNENQIFNNNSLKSTTNRKQKKYIIPQNFLMK